MAPGVTVDGEPPAGQVEVGQVQAGELEGAEAMDGDQGDDEPGQRAVGPVEQAAEPVGGDRGGQPPDGRQGEPAGGVAEDEAFLLERPEQAAQRGEQVPSGVARVPLEDVTNVVCGDLAEAGDVVCPGL